VDGVRTTLYQRAERSFLVRCESAELGDLATELRAAALHQRQHLQNAVMDDSGELGPFTGLGCLALRLVAGSGHLFQQSEV
jgi:hypothetical protein